MFSLDPEEALNAIPLSSRQKEEHVSEVTAFTSTVAFWHVDPKEEKHYKIEVYCKKNVETHVYELEKVQDVFKLEFIKSSYYVSEENLFEKGWFFNTPVSKMDVKTKESFLDRLPEMKIYKLTDSKLVFYKPLWNQIISKIFS